MSFDPKGTAPGLAAGAKAEPTLHNMKCRKQGCNGMQAVAIEIPGQTSRMYRCSTCNHTWGLNVGGAFNL